MHGTATFSRGRYRGIACVRWKREEIPGLSNKSNRKKKSCQFVMAIAIWSALNETLSYCCGRSPRGINSFNSSDLIRMDQNKEQSITDDRKKKDKDQSHRTNKAKHCNLI